MTRSAYDVKLSETEREQGLEVLKEAYALGRIDEEEFGRRMDTVMAAGTGDAMERALHGLPGVPGPAISSGRGTGQGEQDAEHGTTPAERSWAVCAHLLGLCTSFVGPLLMARSAAARRSAFVRRQALEAANFQLSLLGAALATGLLAFVTFGLATVLYIPLALAWMVMPFVGMTHAVNGRPYAYPLAPAVLVRGR